MKRTTLWLAVVGLASLAVVMSLQAKERKPKNPPAPAPQAVQPPQPPPVFTFTTDEEMQEFAKFWQQRQTALSRMAVLQGYWNQEQDTVQRVTQELASRYHLDATKVYTLDVPRKALVEIERKEPAPASGEAPQLGQAPAAAPAAASSN
jgi:hypothetical protein